MGSVRRDWRLCEFLNPNGEGAISNNPSIWKKERLMKKINRRDYLTGLGAGAAGVVAATGLGVFARSDEIVSNRTPARPDPALWPITNTPPNRDSLVTVVIWGLAGIWYNNRKPAEPFLEVGFHSGHPQHPHSLQVR